MNALSLAKPSCLPRELGPFLLYVGSAEAHVAEQPVIEPAQHLTLSATLLPLQDCPDHRGESGAGSRPDCGPDCR